MSPFLPPNMKISFQTTIVLIQIKLINLNYLSLVFDLHNIHISMFTLHFVSKDSILDTQTKIKKTNFVQKVAVLKQSRFS